MGPPKCRVCGVTEWQHVCGPLGASKSAAPVCRKAAAVTVTDKSVTVTRPPAALTRDVAGEREKVAAWMVANGFATGHGDTLEDLLAELGGQVKELRDAWAAYRQAEEFNRAATAERVRQSRARKKEGA